MRSRSLDREIEVASRLAREAGELLLSYLGRGIPVETKAGDEPVTEADRAASALVVAGLRAAFPDDAVLSEEAPDDGARHRARRVWMVDPMDGTKDFIRGETGFSVMIGLCEGGSAIAGVVYHPSERRLYAAARGAGAWLVGGASRRALRVSDVADLAEARLVSSRQNRDAMTERVRDALGVADDKPVGSVGLKIALIAAGEHDLYVNPGARTRLWDLAAPEAILAEAGGRVTDGRGAAVDYARADLAIRDGVIASNGRLHDAALERLRPLLAGSSG